MCFNKKNCSEQHEWFPVRHIQYLRTIAVRMWLNWWIITKLISDQFFILFQFISAFSKLLQRKKHPLSRYLDTKCISAFTHTTWSFLCNVEERCDAFQSSTHWTQIKPTLKLSRFTYKNVLVNEIVRNVTVLMHIMQTNASLSLH